MFFAFILMRSRMLDRKSVFCKNYFVKKIILIFLILLPLSTVLFPSDRKTDAEKNVRFGVLASQKGLWKEAIYRWKRAIELDPTNWKAYNNLAVAYEREGMFNEAINLYQIALQYSKENFFVKKNYEACLSLMERTREKKEQ